VILASVPVARVVCTNAHDTTTKFQVAATNNHDKLLDHVYTKHPPKKPEHRRRTVKEVDGEEVDAPLKDQLRQSLIHYHPGVPPLHRNHPLPPRYASVSDSPEADGGGITCIVFTVFLLQFYVRHTCALEVKSKWLTPSLAL
jgi:hypothetical protein